MRRIPETYEERADLAEYQVEVLEGILYSFMKSSKECEASKVTGLSELRDSWQEYCKALA